MRAGILTCMSLKVPSSGISSSSSSSSATYESDGSSSGSQLGLTLLLILLIQMMIKFWAFNFPLHILFKHRMSTTSDKNKQQTHPRTQPHRKQFNSSSYLDRQGSESQSTTSQFSMNQIFQISTSTLMPLIMRIKEENQYLQEQKERLHTEMKNLEGLGKSIAGQNQQLRHHYTERSNDVKKLLQTMTINTHEQISDIKHQIHAYRQCNRMILKNIEKKSKQMQQICISVQRVQQMLSSTRSDNLQADDNLRNRMLKRKELNNKIDALKRQQDRIDLQALERDICQLALSCREIKDKNKATIKFLQEEQYQLSLDRPNTTHNTLEAIKGVNYLRQEAERISEDIRSQEINNEELRVQDQKLKCKVTQLKRQHQKKTLKLGQLTEDKRVIEENLLKAKQRQKVENAPLKDKKQYERNKLEKELVTKKAKIAKQQSQNQEKIAILKAQKKQNVQKIKECINETERQYLKIKQQQLNPQMYRQENAIAELIHEQVCLDQQLKTINMQMSAMGNPAKQIIKMQYALKQMGRK